MSTAISLAVNPRPPPPARFSKEFFACLTFGDLPSTNLPSILPLHSIDGFVWELSNPGTSTNRIAFDEAIPHQDDLQEIIRDIPLAERNGYDAVLVRLGGPVQSHVRQYTISKIRLMMNIHNNLEAVRLASALSVQLTQRPDNPRCVQALEFLRPRPIISYLPGFVSPVAAWKLGCLVSDVDVLDDVLDAFMEVAYLRLSTRSPQQSPLILPITFTLSLLQLYYQDMKQFNFECLALRALLRKRVVSHTFTGFAFMFCDGVHYISFYYDGGPTLHVGDSLSSNPCSTARKLLPAINWFLDGTQLPPVTDLQMMDISYQGATSRSCGIASFNGIECLVQMPDVGKWEPVDAARHRERHLMSLLQHTIHAGPYKSSTPWYTETAEVDEPFTTHHAPSDSWQNSYAWSCWNTSSLNLGHSFLSIYCNTFTNFTLHPVYDPNLVPSPSCTPSRPPSRPPSVPRTPLRAPIPPDPNTDSDPDSDLPTPRPHPNQSHGFSRLPPIPSPDPYRKQDQPKTPLLPSRSLEIIDLSGLPSSSPAPSPHSVTPRAPCAPRAPHAPHAPRAPRSQTPIHILSDSDVGSPITRPSIEKNKPEVVNLLSDDDAVYGNLDYTRPNRAGATRPPSTSQLPRSKTSQVSHGHHRRVGAVLPIQEGDIFSTVEEAIQAITEEAEASGFVMRRGERKLCSNGIDIKKVTVRCQCYGIPSEHHDLRVHPTDLRKGKSIKTGCKAHVNVNRVPGSSDYHVTTINNDHNHPRILAVGGKAQRPPTADHKSTVAKYAEEGFNRQQIKTILAKEGGERLPEPRQLSNLINASRREALAEIQRYGGDMHAIFTELQQLRQEDPGWEFRANLDDDGRLLALWWQSPKQAELASKYGDVIVNDNTYNRNQYGYALNIGIVIDGMGKSRNIWYCLHEREDTATHEWVLNMYKSISGKEPEVFASDRDPALEPAVKRVFPTAFHLICLHHLQGNVISNLRPAVPPSSWTVFMDDFWDMYRAVSPEMFDERFESLCGNYPDASQYLRSNLYPCRDRWAWAWVSTQFTAGIRTNGRVEAENRINKGFGGPKVSAYQLFQRLLGRIEDQDQVEQIGVREASRRHHPALWQDAFARPLNLIEKYANGFALHTSFKQMEKSVNYTIQVLPLPKGITSWARAFASQLEPGFKWSNGEEKTLYGTQVSDAAYVGSAWLMNKLVECRLDRAVKHVVKVGYSGTKASSEHLVILLDHDRYLCDCCMGSNLGVPCSHFWAILRHGRGLNLVFNLGLIRPRWLKDPHLDLSQIPPVTLQHEASERRIPFSGPEISNPFHPTISTMSTPPPQTRTLAPQEIYRRSSAAIKVLTKGIQTEEQLRLLEEGLDKIKRKNDDVLRARQPRHILDPPVLNPKGRPRTSRLLPARESKGKSSGQRSARKAKSTRNQPVEEPSPAKTLSRRAPDSEDDTPQRPARKKRKVAKSTRTCGRCGTQGHDRRNCPHPTTSPFADSDYDSEKENEDFVSD